MESLLLWTGRLAGLGARWCAFWQPLVGRFSSWNAPRSGFNDLGLPRFFGGADRALEGPTVTDWHRSIGRS